MYNEDVDYIKLNYIKERYSNLKKPSINEWNALSNYISKVEYRNSKYVFKILKDIIIKQINDNLYKYIFVYLVNYLMINDRPSNIIFDILFEAFKYCKEDKGFYINKLKVLIKESINNNALSVIYLFYILIKLEIDIKELVEFIYELDAINTFSLMIVINYLRKNLNKCEYIYEDFIYKLVEIINKEIELTKKIYDNIYFSDKSYLFIEIYKFKIKYNNLFPSTILDNLDKPEDNFLKFIIDNIDFIDV
ncbi:hypothetical protein [Spiroplasma turonicum]|uniref:Uncharacterized protein n=1 Tax=Spiroplasma turonicum TaxID=216946 RepID=A0A0K1P7G7_9MOLU|nr:hypothetical protein [Spiroplasma turonicum]AKU79852.1 hypothetical protein STURON_00606 [Spiroplasma turonicum]ALX70869.1 hypothetical protein STURO_v1c06040 [Spiroplasma turonicum]